MKVREAQVFSVFGSETCALRCHSAALSDYRSGMTSELQRLAISDVRLLAGLCMLQGLTSGGWQGGTQPLPCSDYHICSLAEDSSRHDLGLVLIMNRSSVHQKD